MAMQSRKSPYRGKVRERLAVLAYVKVHGVVRPRPSALAWTARPCARGETAIEPTASPG